MRWATGRRLRILDFDCENRPLSYLGRDFTTPEVTVIAWKPLPRGDLQVVYQPTHSLPDMLAAFLEEWNGSELATGHNIIRHDLPHLNAMLLEHGLPPLGPKMVHDTYGHLKRRASGFAAQETLAAMLGIRAPKVGMGTVAWRQANRLLPDGVDRAVRRAVGDVRQHIALRRRLIELGWLNSPRVWRP